MIIGDSVSDTYPAMLFDTLHREEDFMQVTRVNFPIRSGQVNADPAFAAKLDFTFPDGRTGTWWLDNRMKAMFADDGEYWSKIQKNGFDYILSALKGMKEGTHPRWNANRLIIQLFQKEDLHLSRSPTPPCLTSIAFHPVKDQLSMSATFRAQYTDAKGYGNLYSLAALLLKVCASTGFKPAVLYSVAQKPILKYPSQVAMRFYWALRKA